MADEVHGFDERGARRITDAVRWVERQNPATGGAGGAHRPTRDGWLVRPIRITDAAPTSDGLLTGYVQSIGVSPMDATTWADGEAVWVKWPGGSSQPPELGANTFGELRIHYGVRLTEVTSAGTRRAMWMVIPSSLVVPVQLGNLTPASGSYHDATIDPEGAGAGSTSTCWALCLNSGGNGLASFGPYIGLVSGKVTVSGSERPRVLFSVPGITITGEESDGDPVSAFVQSLAFDNEDFHLTPAGSVVLSHAADEIAISLEGVTVARAVELDFFNPSPGSSGGNVTFTPIDQGSGVVSVEAFVDAADISGVVHDTGDESIAGTKTFTGGLVIPTGASHPGSPVNGQMWHKDGGSLYGYEDSETRRLFTVPDSAYAQGAVPYVNSTTKPVMLAPGTATQAYKTGGAGANPAWGWIDADEMTFTPGTLADWDAGADPGAAADALDQLAERVADLEGSTGIDIDGLTADDFALDDYVPFRDTSGSDNNKGILSRLGGKFGHLCGLTLSLVTGDAAFSPTRSQTPSSTDTGADTVSFATAHGLPSGTKVTVNATAGGLTAGTVYYINAASSTSLSFHTTVANALAGSSKVNLTASITAAVLVMGVAGSTLYAVLDKHNLIRLWDGTRWNIRESSELSLDISAYTASTPYDIWIYDNSGTPTLDATVWSSATARATALARQNGVLVKSGDATRLYVGTIYITSTTGVCEDSWGGMYSIGGRRFVWNYYNSRHKDMAVMESTANWTDSSSGFESMNASTSNRVEFVQGLSDNRILCMCSLVGNFDGTEAGSSGIGLDSTSVNAAQLWGEGATAGVSGINVQTACRYNGTPAVGYHYLQALQKRRAGTITWYSDETRALSGLTAEVVG